MARLEKVKKRRKNTNKTLFYVFILKPLNRKQSDSKKLIIFNISLDLNLGKKISFKRTPTKERFK